MRMPICLLVCAFAGVANAQDYPARPVKVVVPWPAGGTTDLAGRVIAERLAARIGQSFIVENRGGATGMIGATAVAQAPADGYTLLVASAETHAINPFTYQKLTYDPVKDFVLIAPFVINPFSVVVRGDLPAVSLAAWVDLARASPGKYTYSSAGLGSASQLGMEILKGQAGIDLLHVPFQGEAPAVTALLAGQVDAQMLPAGRAEAGIWAQPQGEALYAANVTALGDTAHSPEDIHRIGLDEIPNGLDAVGVEPVCGLGADGGHARLATGLATALAWRLACLLFPLLALACHGLPRQRRREWDAE